MLIYIGVNATLNYNGTFPIPTLVEPTRPTESNITCPLVYAYRIYQTINTSIDQIAFERMDFLSVDVYVWSPDFESVQYEPYSSKAFSERHNNTRFKYIGDATAGKQFGAYIKLNILPAELVQLVRDWFKIEEKNQSLYYCKTDCSTRVIKILQPCK